jgi:hypothetical protein
MWSFLLFLIHHKGESRVQISILTKRLNYETIGHGSVMLHGLFYEDKQDSNLPHHLVLKINK